MTLKPLKKITGLNQSKLNNVFRCRVCGRYAISEELNTHECRGFKGYKIKDDLVLVFDGVKWYPLDSKRFDPTLFDTNKNRRELYRTNFRIVYLLVL